MSYSENPDYDGLVRLVAQWAELKRDYGATGVASILAQAEQALELAIEELKELPIDPGLTEREPNDLQEIKRLRPPGPRRLWQGIEREEYRDRLEGALIGRFAGCTLGAPVEGWSITRMEALAKENGDTFPPSDYWTNVPDPFVVRYGMSTRETYTRGNINGVPVDDDIAYTLLGLLVLEEAGPLFSPEDIGAAWLRYLPLAYGAERVALDNLRRGCAAILAGEIDNPYTEGLGADIRSDPWGYAAPGWPELAADMAYRDATISHRRQGVYGAMFFSAAISAAFAVDNPVEALEIGLTEIPRECALARAVRWALDVAQDIGDYRQARDAVEERYQGRHTWHVIPNACLTVFGIARGGRDITKIIGETVAMGRDSDCTAATAGSIVGAVAGKAGIPEHWYVDFDDTVHSYLIGQPRFSIRDLVDRFTAQATMAYSPRVAGG